MANSRTPAEMKSFQLENSSLLHVFGSLVQYLGSDKLPALSPCVTFLFVFEKGIHASYVFYLKNLFNLKPMRELIIIFESLICASNVCLMNFAKALDSGNDSCKRLKMQKRC